MRWSEAGAEFGLLDEWRGTRHAPGKALSGWRHPCFGAAAEPVPPMARAPRRAHRPNIGGKTAP